MNSGGTELQSLGGSVLLEGEAPPHWQPIIEMPIVVVVGVTGVGKSTTIELLTKRLPCFVLPDRRAGAIEPVILGHDGDLWQGRHAELRSRRGR